MAKNPRTISMLEEREKKKKEEELRKALEKSNFTEDMYKVPTPKLLYDNNNYYKFDGGLEPYNPKPATVPGSSVKLDVPKKKENTTQKVLNTSATIKSGVNTGVSSNWEKDDKYKDRKNDSIFRSVNNTKEPTKASKAFMDNDFWVNDSSKELQFMTFSSFMLPEEKKKYNSLYDQKGRTAATEYAYSLIPTFRERRRKQKEFEATEQVHALKKYEGELHNEKELAEYVRANKDFDIYSRPDRRMLLENKADEVFQAVNRTKEGLNNAWVNNEAYKYYTYLNDVERAVYNYYYNKDGADKANEYLKTIDRLLDKRVSDKMAEEVQQFTEEYPVAGFVGHVAASPFAVAGNYETIKQNVSNAIKGENVPVNIYSPNFNAVRMRNTISEELTKDKGTVASLLISTGLSMGDMATALPFGSAAPLIMASNAAADAAYDATERGASAGQALASGIASGAAEYYAEKLPIENLFKIAKMPKTGIAKYVTEIAKQAHLEGSEEFITQIINNIADSVIMGDKSNYNKRVLQYVGQGMSKKEAEKAAFADLYIKEAALAYAGGAISGGFFGAAGSVKSAVSGNAANAATPHQSAPLTASPQGEANIKTPPSTEMPSSEGTPKATDTTTQPASTEMASGEAPVTPHIAEYEQARRAVLTEKTGKAIDTPVLTEHKKLTHTQRKLINDARKAGLDVTFFKSTSKDYDVANIGVNGSYLNGHIYININAENPYSVVLGHEVVHQMKETDVESYNKLVEIVRNELGADSDFDSLTGLDQEEAVADIMGDIIADPQKYKRVFAQDVSFGQKVLDYINGLIERFKASTANENGYVSEYTRKLLTARNQLTKIMADSVVNMQNKADVVRSGEVRDSVIKINGKKGDYGIGVYLDTDLFKGIHPRNWNKPFAKFVYDNLAGKDIKVFGDNGNEEIISFAKEKERVKKDGANNSHIVIDKLARATNNTKKLAIVHIDELLETAVYDNYSAEHSHQWLDENGWEHRKTYIQDIKNNIYEATLNIAKARDGRNILYDVSNIIKVDEGAVSSTQNERDSLTNRQPSVTISQNEPTVNTQYMQNGKNDAKNSTMRGKGDGDFDNFADKFTRRLNSGNIDSLGLSRVDVSNLNGFISVEPQEKGLYYSRDIGNGMFELYPDKRISGRDWSAMYGKWFDIEYNGGSTVRVVEPTVIVENRASGRTELLSKGKVVVSDEVIEDNTSTERMNPSPTNEIEKASKQQTENVQAFSSNVQNASAVNEATDNIPQNEDGGKGERQADTNADIIDESRKVDSTLRGTRTLFVKKLAEIMNIPASVNKDVMKPLFNEAWEQYKAFGELTPHMIDNIFEKAYENGRIINDEFYNTYKGLKDELKVKTIVVPQDIQTTIAQNYKNFEEWRKKQTGRLRIRVTGTLLSERYKELAKKFPDVFDANITNPEEQLKLIIKTKEDILTQKNKKNYALLNLLQKRIYIPSDVASTIENLDKFQDVLGKDLYVEDKASSIGTIFAELQSNYPELFTDSIAEPADQLLKIAEVADSIRITETNMADYADGAYAEDYKEYMRNEFNNAFDSVLKQFKMAKRYVDSRNKDDIDVDSNDIEYLREVHKEYEAVKKSLAKMKKRLLLTDGDMNIITELINGNMKFDEIPDTYNKDAIVKVYYLQKHKDELENIILQHQINVKEGKINDAKEFVKNSSEWNKTNQAFNFSLIRTPRRMVDFVIKNKAEADKFYNKYFAPMSEAARQANKFVKKQRDKVAALKLNKEERIAVQMLAELKAAEATLDNPDIEGRWAKKLNKNKKELGIVYEKYKNGGYSQEQLDRFNDAIKVFREIYDECIKLVNPVLIKNGQIPIGELENYFPHYWEYSSDSKFFGWLFDILQVSTVETELAGDVAGKTHNYKSGRPGSVHEKTRIGNRTMFDAVEGFENYIEQIANVIYFTEPAQNLRVLGSVLREQFSDKAYEKKLRQVVRETKSNRVESLEEYWKTFTDLAAKRDEAVRSSEQNWFIRYIDEYVNGIVGKASNLDRSIEELYSRQVSSFLSKLSNNHTANLLVGNIRTAATNLISIFQAAGTTKNKYALMGLWDTITDFPLNNVSYAEKSTFLTNRNPSKAVNRTALEKTFEKLNFMEYTDWFAANVVWRMKFYENINEFNMSEEQACADADEYCKWVVAGRSKGEMAPIFNSKNPIIKAYLSFQVEPINQMFLYKEEAKYMYSRYGIMGVAKNLFMKTLLMYLINEFFEKETGSKVTFEPVGLATDFVAALAGYRVPNFYDMLGGEKPFKSETALQDATADVLESLPVVSGLFGGGYVPVMNLWDMGVNVKDTLTDKNLESDEKAIKIGGGVLSTGAKLLWKHGLIGQIEKTYKGIKTVMDGGIYTESGNLKYPIEKTFGNYTQGSLFGKAPLTRKYYDSGMKSFSDSENEEYLKRVNEGEVPVAVYADITNRRRIKETATMSNMFYRTMNEGKVYSLTPEKDKAVYNEVINLQKELDENGIKGNVLFKVPDASYEVDGEKYTLRSKEYEKFVNDCSKNAMQGLRDLTDTNGYKNADTKTKAKLIGDVYEYSRAKARADVSPEYKESESFKDYAKTALAEKNNISPGDYFGFKALLPEKYNEGDAYRAAIENGFNDDEADLLVNLSKNYSAEQCERIEKAGGFEYGYLTRRVYAEMKRRGVDCDTLYVPVVKKDFSYSNKKAGIKFEKELTDEQALKLQEAYILYYTKWLEQLKGKNMSVEAFYKAIKKCRDDSRDAANKAFYYWLQKQK